MNFPDHLDNNEQTNQVIQSLSPSLRHHRQRVAWSNRECIICGSKAIGMNFGAPTCAPCKAFFRRNARRKEVLESPCHQPDKKNLDINERTLRYSQIRRCSSCRLRRCYEVGMKEELVRTDEENERHKQLVDKNRKHREILRQEEPKQENQLSILQCPMNNNSLLTTVDWCHLSNIVYAYDTCCLKTYLEQRENIFLQIASEREPTMTHYSVILINSTYSLSSFLKALPVFQTISPTNQSFLFNNNLRRLIFLNIHELNQSCFSEPWQVTTYKSAWQFLFGPELCKQYAYTEELAGKCMIADPIVTRLWLIVLFLSTPLFSYYDSHSSIVKIKQKLSFIDAQQAYVTLLWRYLLHRHGHMESVRIYSNLVRVFLNMLRVGININIRLRTENELRTTHETLNQLSKLDINDDQ